MGKKGERKRRGKGERSMTVSGINGLVKPLSLSDDIINSNWVELGCDNISVSFAFFLE